MYPSIHPPIHPSSHASIHLLRPSKNAAGHGGRRALLSAPRARTRPPAGPPAGGKTSRGTDGEEGRQVGKRGSRGAEEQGSRKTRSGVGKTAPAGGIRRLRRRHGRRRSAVRPVRKPPSASRPQRELCGRGRPAVCRQRKRPSAGKAGGVTQTGKALCCWRRVSHHAGTVCRPRQDGCLPPGNGPDALRCSPESSSFNWLAMDSAMRLAFLSAGSTQYPPQSPRFRCLYFHSPNCPHSIVQLRTASHRSFPSGIP